MNWPEEWFQKSKKILLGPEDFYKEAERHDGYTYPMKFAVTSGIVVGVLAEIVNILTGLAKTSPRASILSSIIGGIIGGTLGLLLGAGLVHVFVRLFDGKDFQKTAEVVAYSTGINALIGWIPVVNLIAFIYGVYARIKGIEVFHEMDTDKAAASVILPLVITLLIALAAVVTTQPTIQSLGGAALPSQAFPGLS